MNLLIAAVGRAARTPEAALVETYATRARGLGPQLGFAKFDTIEIDPSKKADAPARKADEALRLAARIPDQAYRFVLDERGETLSSETFARRLGRLRDEGIRDCAFVIGGPDGLAEDLRRSAGHCIALGPQTWPHLLVRAMLAEQIYRSMTILAGHPYHRV
jgi:23S rRNA (pseudouridine1915-N3)-methyltransferase